MNRRRGALVLLAGVGLVASACAAGPRLFVNQQADMTYYRKVAVLPFTNLSGDPFASGRVTRAFVTELVIANRYDLVDPAQFSAELDRRGGQPDAQGNVDPAKLKEAAAAVEATGVIRGAVTEYQMRRSGTDEYPVVSLDVEMVDAATGNRVWRVSESLKGKGRLPVMGGSGSRTFARVTQEVCTRIVQLLQQKAF